MKRLRRGAKMSVLIGVLTTPSLFEGKSLAKGSGVHPEKPKVSAQTTDPKNEGPKARKTKVEPKEETWEQTCFLGVKANTVPQDVAAVSIQNLDRAKATLVASQVQFNERPVVQYFAYEETEVSLAAGYFVDCKALNPANVEKFEIASGSMIFVEVHETPEESGATHQMMHQWIKEKGREITGAPLEVYEEGPFNDLTKKVRMKVVYPVNSITAIKSK